MSEIPRRLRLMAELSPETSNVTKIVPAGKDFLLEVAAHVTRLEQIVYLYCDPMAMPDEEARFLAETGSPET